MNQKVPIDWRVYNAAKRGPERRAQLGVITLTAELGKHGKFLVGHLKSEMPLNNTWHLAETASQNGTRLKE